MWCWRWFSHLAIIRWGQTIKPHWGWWSRKIHLDLYIQLLIWFSLGCITGISHQACISPGFLVFSKWHAYPFNWWVKRLWINFCSLPSCTPHIQSMTYKYCQLFCHNIPICHYGYLCGPRHCTTVWLVHPFYPLPDYGLVFTQQPERAFQNIKSKNATALLQTFQGLLILHNEA